jgi:hypothetical protein
LSEACSGSSAGVICGSALSPCAAAKISGLSQSVQKTSFASLSSAGVSCDGTSEEKTLRIPRPINFIDRPYLDLERRIGNFDHDRFQRRFFFCGDIFPAANLQNNYVDLGLSEATLLDRGSLQQHTR